MSSTDYPARRFGGPVPPWLGNAENARPIPAEVWITGALVVIAAVIRIVVLTNQSFWMDEALTAYEAHLPFGAMINTVIHVETTPPLYFVLIWAWAHVFGTSEAALRSVSMLAGVSLVPLAYLSARDLVSPRAGAFAAAFVTFNPFLIWYSQEARAYMLLAALSAASFFWFVRARREPTGRTLAWWAIWSSLAIATHFFAGFLVAPEALWLLWSARTRLTAAAVVCVGAVQLAMLPFAVTDTGHGTGWIAQISRKVRVSQAISEWGVSILYRRTTIAVGLLGGAVLLVATVLLVVFGGDARVRRGAAVAAVLGGAVWVLPLLAGLLGQDYFLSRNVIPAVLPLAVVLGAACAAPRLRLLGGLLAVVLIGMFAYATIQVQTSAYLQRPDWRSVARALGAPTVPRAIIAANGFTADSLKIYLPHVNWVQPQSQKVWVQEIDVVGDRKQIPLRPVRIVLPKQAPIWLRASGAPTPALIAPRGARLVDRFVVRSWIIGRFMLDRPRRMTVRQLIALAPEYFHRTPNALLIFFQRVDR
ncbi:MAG: glycosyltransferase family 39 protein [Solirubrobacterales bacterium]|nr:glycosyltransferase family 39 protein [Solirubrobacterales bacterium]